MGIGYRIEPALSLTLTVFDGKVTGEEWQSAIHKIFTDPGWPPGRLNLTDLRTADSSLLTADDRAAVFAINAAHAHKLVGMKSAAIGGAHFEAARRFERDDRSSGLRLIAFDDLPPACAWLGVDLDAARSMIADLQQQLRGPKAPLPAT